MPNRKFSSINQIPKRLRKVGDGALSLEQAETLINAAEDKAAATGTPFSLCYGQERAKFEDEHAIQNGFWVAT